MADEPTREDVTRDSTKRRKIGQDADAMDMIPSGNGARENRGSGGEGSGEAQDSALRPQENQTSNGTQSAAGTARQTSNDAQPAAQPAKNNSSQPATDPATNPAAQGSNKQPAIVKSTEEEPLFIPENRRENDREEAAEDPEGAPLYVHPSTAINQDVTTVGWANSKYINRYGARNAAQYRIDPVHSSGYDRPPAEEVSSPDNRHGDLKDGKKWRYGSGHIHGIFGVAWVGDGGDLEDDLRLIDPASKPKRWPLTYVLVGWKTDPMSNEIEKTWETRTALRVRWGGSTKADKHIYTAACEAQDRYQETINGTRTRTSKSPSVTLIREASVMANRVSPSRAPSRRASVDGGSDDTKVYLRAFLDALGKKDLSELDLEENKRLMRGLQSMI